MSSAQDDARKGNHCKNAEHATLKRMSLRSQFVFKILFIFTLLTFVFPECVARVPVSLGGLGVRLCSPSFAFAVATVGNRLCVRRKALHSGERVWSGPESVSS